MWLERPSQVAARTVPSGQWAVRMPLMRSACYTRVDVCVMNRGAIRCVDVYISPPHGWQLVRHKWQRKPPHVV